MAILQEKIVLTFIQKYMIVAPSDLIVICY